MESDPDHGFRYVMVLRPDQLDPAKANRLERLKTLLSLKPDQTIFPIMGTPLDLTFSGEALVIEARSILSVMLYLAGGIHLPEPLAKDFPAPFADASDINWSGPAGTKSRLHPESFFNVHVGDHAPDDAYVAIAYDGIWFWIDARDTNSKATFSLVQYLVRLQTARGAQPKPGVLLTIPTR